MDESDIDFSRGDEDIVFIETDVDTEGFSEETDPREEILEEMEEEGLEVENAEVIGIFKEELSLLLKEDAKITLNGEKIYGDEE